MPSDLPVSAEVHFDAASGDGGLCTLARHGNPVRLDRSALHASGTDPNRDLKESTRGGTSSQRQNRFRSALVATEIALSVVLLSGAGLLVHSFWNALRVNPGLDPNGLMVARIWIPLPNNPAMNRYRTAPAITGFSREILRRVRTLPGIEDAAMGADNSVPLVTNTRNQTGFSLPDQSDSAVKQRSAESASVSPEFFQVLRTPLLRGRFFTETDTDKSKPVVIVDEAFAKQYLSGHDLGSDCGRDRESSFRPIDVDWEIVGVVGDVRDDGLDTPAAPRFYRPLYQARANEMAIFLRGASDSSGLKQAVTGNRAGRGSRPAGLWRSNHAGNDGGHRLPAAGSRSP